MAQKAELTSGESYGIAAAALYVSALITERKKLKEKLLTSQELLKLQSETDTKSS
jgi:hypothetical protein